MVIRTKVALVRPMQEPFMYFENPDVRAGWPKAEFLSDEEYGKCMAAFPRLCSDIIAADPWKKGFWLAKRTHHSAFGRWCFGGGQRRGQTPREAVVHLLKRETGIALTPNEPQYLFTSEMYWVRRNPEPQNMGEHCRVSTFIFVPTEEEIANIKLDQSEYDAEHGLKLYGREEIEMFPENNRVMLLQYWNAAFGLG